MTILQYQLMSNVQLPPIYSICKERYLIFYIQLSVEEILMEVRVFMKSPIILSLLLYRSCNRETAGRPFHWAGPHQ